VDVDVDVDEERQPRPICSGVCLQYRSPRPARAARPPRNLGPEQPKLFLSFNREHRAMPAT
jgi:hypothetical protein